MHLAVCLFLVGCSDSARPRIESVSPAWAWVGERPVLAIAGAGFRPRLRVDVGSGEAAEDAGFRGKVGPAAFDRVTIESAGELRATLPAGLGPGVYDLEIVTPEGERLTLPGAFRVIDLDGGVPPDAGLPDGGLPDRDAGPPDWVDDFDCSNGRCDGSFPTCAGGAHCPACGAFAIDVSRGSWRYQDGSLEQEDEDDRACDAWAADLDLEGLAVEADVTVTALGSGTPRLAGLIFRTGETCGDANRYYTCLLDYGAQELLLAAFDGGVYLDYAWTEVPTAVSGLAVGDTVRMRARASGGRVYCEADGAAEVLDHADDIQSHGSVGFRTYYTQARFDGLRVWRE